MRHLRKRYKIVLLAFVLLVSVIAVFVTIIVPTRNQEWKDAHPLSDPHVGFQMYTPTKLPEGFRITGKRISVSSAHFYDKKNGDPHKPERVTLEMNLRTEDWVYSIRELRVGIYSDSKNDIASTVNNYDPTSTKPSCTNRTSGQGREYRLCHWVDYGRISVFEVKFIEENTLIETTFPASLQKPIESNEIDTFVDSFQKADPEGIELSIDTI